jgi:hypothetical protein
MASTGGAIELRAFRGRDEFTGRKRQADKALAAFVSGLNQGGPVARRGRSLGDRLDRWFESSSSDWSPGTAYQTRWLIDHRRAATWC